MSVEIFVNGHGPAFTGRAFLSLCLVRGGECVSIMDRLSTTYYINMEDGYFGLFVDSIFILIFAFDNSDILQSCVQGEALQELFSFGRQFVILCLW